MSSRPPTSKRSRIGIVFQGDPSDPTAWSGVPAGVTAGLLAAGAEPVGIDARPPGFGSLAHRLRMSWAQVSANPWFCAASSVRAKRLAERADLDGAITLGSGFELRSSVPSITYEDMTVVQAMRRGDPVYDSLSEAAKRRWKRRQGSIYARSRGCGATSNWVADSLREDYGVPEEKIHVIGLGRNAEVSVPATKDWSVPRYLWIGLDWKRKRGADVVAAFASVRERFPEATLDLVGSHPPVGAPGVRGHGTLRRDSASEQRLLAELLGSATCFLMPSEYEPFGIAYVDAGAAGVPSIGTTVGGARDAIGPGGVTIDPGDPEALLRSMLELAAPDRARELGDLARGHSELLTWQAIGERLLRALDLPGLDKDHLKPFLDSTAA